MNCEELIKKFKAKRNKSNNQTKTPEKMSKKHVKNKQSKRQEPNVDWSSDEEFEVDRILDVHFKKNGDREFLVSWKGYPASENSWEPENNLQCTDLIEKFMHKLNRVKSLDQKELRIARTPTYRFTLAYKDKGRRLSKRLDGKQR